MKLSHDHFFLRKSHGWRYFIMVRELLYALVGLSLLAAADLAAVTHTVVKGDTLYGLSRNYGVSVDEITKANPGINATALKIGQKIEIPKKQDAANSGTTSPTTPPPPTVTTPPTPAPTAPTVHVVKKGDTLSAIARQYNVTIGDLTAWNKLASTQINIGQKLTVTAPPTVSSVATAIVSNTATVGGTTAQPPLEKPPTVIQPRTGNYLFLSKVKRQIDSPKITRQWRYIVVHHSGTTRGNAKIFDYDHRRRGMENGLAYHFIIGNGTDSGDGEIEVGERWRRQIKGGHLRPALTQNGIEINEMAIGICLVGDFEKDRPTRKQIAALIELTNYLNGRVMASGYPRPHFTVHGDIHQKHTTCPGKNFPKAALYKIFRSGGEK